ncbi:feruloyl-CoA synthase [Phenylobacterium aquaticum]|uniref:feruloyl-CoA synthase n=1 Tax=Phenylobacterium aquaticum TaxID=1763816 RepID=UPI001F5D07CB|nr:feruloyl-CoA synthase [Phenylobacterium aquaticum]MCI3131314.1 feruloyl-CoA synthase [Phenylobacterium aquaticum]
MDAEIRTQTAPFRDPRYAPRRLEVERRADGVMILTNPTPVVAPFATMTGPLGHWAQRDPGRVWLAERSGEGWRELTYGAAHEQVMALAGGLRALGVVSKRPLLILARNGLDHALIKYAAMSQGMPAAPVSPQYGLPGANLARLAHAVEVLQPAAIFTEDAALFGEALEAPFLAGLPVIAAANPRPGDVSFADLLKSAPAAASADPDDTAKYLLTSGSTGRPKAVICRHRNIATNAAQVAACFDDPDPPVIVNAAPWSHSLGANAILHMAAHRGGTVYIDAGQPVAGRFAETVRNLKEISPTYHNMVPAGWMLFAGELERDEDLARKFFARVRVMQYGGANLGQDICDRIQAVAVRTVGEKISFASGYGATETGPTAANVHWTNDRMGLMGLPLPGTAVKLAPAGDKLEFRVKGPQVTSGYLGLTQVSADSFDEDGFYRLGDAARFIDPEDPAQGLAFDGRLSENFKLASGTFVSVGELRIQAVGAVGDAVTDAVVCGEGRETLGLLFYPKPGHAPEEIAAAVRAGVAALNARAKGSGGRVARALVLPTAPDANAGEITDKGYIAQALARSLRAADVERLFAEPADPDVMVFA